MSVASPVQPVSTLEAPRSAGGHRVEVGAVPPPAGSESEPRRQRTAPKRTSPTAAEATNTTSVCDEDRYLMVAMHLSPFLFFIGLNYFALAIPPIIWLVRRNESVFADDHGRELVNFCLSFIVLHVVLAITIIGLLLLPVLWILAIIAFIRGAIAAGRGEYFRYPVTIRFLR